MKLVLYIFMLYLFGETSVVSNTEEKCFYFCISRPIKSDSLSNTIFFTDIKDTVCTAIQSGKLVNKWSEFVDIRCQSSSGCTSDLNFYTTKEDARKNLENVIKKYGASHKLEKVRF